MGIKNWERAEEIVRKLCGGRRTPGSGNKGLKGDVQIWASSWMLEVKQTDSDVLTLQADWFHELEKERARYDVALVIFFELRGYVYWQEGLPSEPKTWRTMNVSEEDLPPVIDLEKTRWVLAPISTLKELKQ